MVSTIAIALGLTTFVAGLVILFIGVIVVLRNLLMISVTKDSGTNGGTSGGTSGTKSSNVYDAIIKFFDLIAGLNLKPREGFMLIVIGLLLIGLGFQMTSGVPLVTIG